MTTSRTHFNETWLTEMPENIGYMESFEMLEYNLADLKKHNLPIVNIKNNLFKHEGVNIRYYWYEIDDEILLAAELTKQSEALVVNIVGKNPIYKGEEPYASDLYSEILKDTKYSIRIMSDEVLIEEGFNIWAKLLQQGHKISIYDRSSSSVGQTLKTVNSVEELKKYHQKGTDYQDIQYILSEHSFLGETRAYFNTRRMRELTGLSLVDYFGPGPNIREITGKI